MKHLTPEQLYKIIDNTVNIEESLEYNNHLEKCHVCSQALSRYKFINTSIAEYPREKMSYNFTENLVGKIYKDKQKSFITRFISDKGFYIMGFLLILIIMNAVMNMSSEIAPDGSPEKNNNIFSNISDSFQQIYDQFSIFVLNIFGLISPSFSKAFFFIAAAILILGLLDKILSRKFMKAE